MTQYTCILTSKGQDKQAAAQVSGAVIKITQLAIGDGAGNEITPDPLRTTLVNEVRREQITRLFKSADKQITVEQYVPFDVGGWWVREVGLIDADGDLVAVANMPPAFKPAPGNGAARAMIVRVVLTVGSDGTFVGYLMDPSKVLATVAGLDAAIAATDAKIAALNAQITQLTPLLFAAL